MKIVYEQGDIVFNKNNNNYGIVIGDFCNGSVKILVIDTTVYVSSPPQSALNYVGQCDLKKILFDIVKSEVDSNQCP